MQAIVFFAIFGFMAATVGGIIAFSNVTTQKLRVLMVEQTKQQFADLSTLINKQMVPLQMQSPPPASGSTQPIVTYICTLPKAGEIVDCSTGVPRDPWHRAIAGTIVRQTKIMMSRNGLLFNVPVTGYALLSQGPDGVTSSNVPSTPASIAELTTQSVKAGDDILTVFTDEIGQQANLEAIRQAVDNIGHAAQSQYQRQFNRIKPNLQNIYNDYMSTHGTTDVNAPAVQNAWKVWSDSRAPSYAKLYNGSSLNSYTLGADGDIAYLQRDIPSGGRMVLSSSYINSDAPNNGVNDVIAFSLVGSGTVWQPAVTSTCSVSNPVNCVVLKGGI